MIAIAGLPASGKTTLASLVIKGLNDRYQKEGRSHYPDSSGNALYHRDIAYYVPLDGFHLNLAQLAAMPDPEEAAYRRGAPFTFDGQKYFELVQRLRERITPESTAIYAPSFDHAIKDPVANDIVIPPTARIVLLEGLYLALNEEPWRGAAKLMDELWFIDVPMDIAIERLVQRHVATGLSPDFHHARTRVMASDMQNGQYLLDHRLRIDDMIPSIDDDNWKPKKDDMQRALLPQERHVPNSMGSVAE